VLTRKGFRYRIYPTEAQAVRLRQWEDALRFLWNLANEQRLMVYSRCRCDRKYPTAFDQINELTELRAMLPWLADVPRNVCAQLLIELDRAWQRCFKRLGRSPNWKRKNQDVLGLCEPHPGVFRLEPGAVVFPKLGLVRVVLHRPVEGTPKTCTIRRDGDQWFSSILCEIERPEPIKRTEPVVALDRGITHLFATSDGRLAENPRYLQKALKRLAHAQRVVSRRKKGSKNRQKAKARVARLHRKITRQRKHVLHVESARLAKNHGTVVIEKLNVAGMIQGHCARSIADAGWSEFSSMLRYKLAWSGATLIEVPAAYSSQTCNECGVIDADSRHGEKFCCTSCGHADHADLNAAKILLGRANRPALPVEGSPLEGSLRSRKSVVLRVPRRASESSAL
jgi:putative transposase